MACLWRANYGVRQSPASEPVRYEMRKLSAQFVKALAASSERLLYRFRGRQRQICLRRAADMVAEQPAENRPGSDSAAVITMEGDDVGSKPVEFGEAVAGHSDHAVPA